MKVANLRIAVQSGGSSTIFAAWNFAKNTGSGGAPVNGDIVRIKSGSTWYNGVAIDSWVFNYRWYIRELIGKRAVIDKSPDSGSYSIMSPIYIGSLTKEGTSTDSANAEHLDHFAVRWEYNTGDGVWFKASESTTKDENATYSYPSNAILVRCIVSPVSKTYGEGKATKSYWTAEDTTAEFVVGDSPPAKPSSAPNISIDQNYMLKSTVDNISDSRTDALQFELYNGDNRIDGGVVSVVTARATYYRAVSPGGKYRVRYRAVNYVAGTPVYSDWSPYSGETETAPDGVLGVTVEVESETTASLKWRAEPTATSYVVEASTDERYFDSSSEVKSQTVTANSAFMTGLTKGKRWFFRVRAKNSHGESPWSSLVNTVIGTKPEPPTTWSLTSNAAVGDNLVLYWVHNTEDGSKMVGAEVELIINGVKSTKILTAEQSKSDREKIHTYKVDNREYRTGGKIEWRVRTTGVTKEFSDWSTQRVINIYTPPTVEIRLGEGNKPNLFRGVDMFTGDWINLTDYQVISDRHKGHAVARTKAMSKGLTQKIAVKAGQKFLFSAYIKSSNPNDTAIIFNANIDDDVDNTVTNHDSIAVTVYEEWTLYSTGITIDKDGYIMPRLSKYDTSSGPDDTYLYVSGMDLREQAEGGHGGDGTIRNYPIPFSITARPATQRAVTTHISVIAKDSYEVVSSTGERKTVSADSEVYSRVHVMTDNELYQELTPKDITLVNGQSYYLKVSVSMDSGLVAQSQQLLNVRWSGTDYLPDGFVEYDSKNMSARIRPYCFDLEGNMPRNVTLTVLRINANGSLTLIGSGIDNDGSAAIVDPHPTLDYARYRVVSTDIVTGLNEYSDLAPLPIHDPAIVIQWDEPWKPYSKDDQYRPESQIHGSMVRLPYNVDVSEKFNVDTVLTEYIGRKNPVSYYGTQKGVSATWNTDIPKEDKDLIYQLRRLAEYSGDVYVREPNGSGYYASISLSFSIKHRVLVVPISIEVKKVESGEI